MKKLRKVLCVGMAVALLASVSGQALAATYDLTEGSISVSAPSRMMTAKPSVSVRVAVNFHLWPIGTPPFRLGLFTPKMMG